MLLLVVAASAVQGSRWSVCRGGCGTFTVAAFGAGHGCGGASAPDATAPVDGCACCVEEVAAEAASIGCCGAEQSEAPGRSPTGDLLALQPECCSVIELGLEDGRTGEVADPSTGSAVAWIGAVGRSTGAARRSARYRRLGRAPPRVDRLTALRACTVLLI